MEVKVLPHGAAQQIQIPKYLECLQPSFLINLPEMDEEGQEEFDVEVGEDLDVDSVEVVVDKKMTVNEQQRSQQKEEMEAEADED